MDDELREQRHGEPTTTHAGYGAGHPRLLVHRDDERYVYELRTPLTRIGSADGCELRLPGTEALHASIEHDERDEYVLTLIGAGQMNANPESTGTPGDERSETLRTGARFTAGDWTLVYQRDEYADHGRPFGGRQGGELSEQPQQEPRPHYETGPIPRQPKATR